jgi:cell division protein FtsI (penicillin-binding protein 3)
MLLAGFGLAGLALFAALADLQAVRPERFRALGEDQRLRTVPLIAPRGSVLDRGGFVLAMSARSHQVVADPTMVTDPAATAAVLGPVLGLDPAELAGELVPEHPRHRYQRLARHLDDDTAARLAELFERHRDLMVGIFVRPDEKRVNPAGRLAANLVGRTDPDQYGVSGIEAMYDGVLAGTDGSETFERGRFGSISVGERIVRPPDAGSDVVLSIDHRLQYVVDQSLIEHCEAVQANGASAALSDPRTGELLALSSVVRDDEGRCVVPGSNRALIDTFEPGSVLKLVTTAAAVELLGLSADSPVPVPRSVPVGDKTFQDLHPLPAGDHPMWRVFAESSNVGTIGLALRVGPEELYRYLTVFGFGAPTGIDFRGESTGTLRPPGDWWGSDLGSIAIGQGVTVNVVQLLAAYNIVANDGLYVAPTLVRAVVDADGERHPSPQPARRVISEQAADELTRMLTSVVVNGTGRAAAIAGYDVAGKTGTAWKAVENADGVKRYVDDQGERHYVVTFAGFVPADQPQLSMVVMVDEPRIGTTASVVAAPVFADIVSHALRILGIPPTDTGHRIDGGLVRGTPAPAPPAGQGEVAARSGEDA